MNTTKIVRDVSKILLLTLVGAGVGFFGSCGKKSGSGEVEQDATVVSNTTGELSEEEIIEDVLNEAITRLRYGDKSGLYENEFEYSNDETNFDEYLGMGQIRAAQADTITFVEVRHATFFEHDSAVVDVTVHFEGPTGQKSFHRDRIVVYYHRGRWIKPTVSVIDLQVNYDNMIRVADSAAAAEAEERH